MAVVDVRLSCELLYFPFAAFSLQFLGFVFVAAGIAANETNLFHFI